MKTGVFDLNTLREDGESFECGKKKLRIQKYPDRCERGISGLRTCWQKFATLIPKNIRTCLAKRDQAGCYYVPALQLNYA